MWLQEVKPSIVAMEDEVRRYESVCQLTKAWVNALTTLTTNLRECAFNALAKQRTPDKVLESKVNRRSQAHPFLVSAPMCCLEINPCLC